MKAVLVEETGAIDRLTVKEHKLPEPDENQVLIRNEYVGVNFPDLLIVKGLYQFQPELPFSPGGEVAGVVAKVGKNVKHLKVGDRVVSGSGWGGFAEETLSFGSNTHKIPEGVSTKDAAATMMTFGTVIHALKDRAELKSGETLAILGAAGGVGAAAIQVGKQLGATIIACASTDEKLTFCKGIGAEEVVNYSVEKIKDRFRQLTKERGVNVIFDPVGGALSESAFRGIAPGGRHLVVGFASGTVPAIPWNLPLLKSASIVGVFWGSFFRCQAAANAENIQLMLNWLKDRKITATIDHVLPLSDAVQALKIVENRDVKGKIVLAI